MEQPSLEKLTELVVNGFSSIERRFDEIKNELEQTNNQLGAMNERLTSVESKIIGINRRLDDKDIGDQDLNYQRE